MSFPAGKTVGHRVYTPGTKDSHGKPTKAWADPVDVAVYGYGPPSRTVEAEPGGTQVLQGLQILAPKFDVQPEDQFVIDGKTYEVFGEVADWDNGPFGYTPGIVINVKRAEGGL